jgi:hypothetical protein
MTQGYADRMMRPASTLTGGGRSPAEVRLAWPPLTVAQLAPHEPDPAGFIEKTAACAFVNLLATGESREAAAAFRLEVMANRANRPFALLPNDRLGVRLGPSMMSA